MSWYFFTARLQLVPSQYTWRHFPHYQYSISSFKSVLISSSRIRYLATSKGTTLMSSWLHFTQRLSKFTSSIFILKCFRTSVNWWSAVHEGLIWKQGSFYLLANFLSEVMITRFSFLEVSSNVNWSFFSIWTVSKPMFLKWEQSLTIMWSAINLIVLGVMAYHYLYFSSISKP